MHTEGTISVAGVNGTGGQGPTTTKPFKRGLWPRGAGQWEILGATALPGGSFLLAGEINLQDLEPAARGVARITADGSFDKTAVGLVTGTLSSDNPDGRVEGVLPEMDSTGMATGKVFLYGTIDTYNGTAVRNIIRVNRDGSLDGTFAAFVGESYQTVEVALQELDAATGLPTGRLYVGGDFDTVFGASCPPNLVRLMPDGSLDGSFNAPFPDSWVGTLQQLPNPSGGTYPGLWVGGQLYNYDTTPLTTHLVRVTSTGALDAAFTPSVQGTGNPYVGLMQAQLDATGDPTGNMFVGGSFTMVSAQPLPGLVLLDNTGARVMAFDPRQYSSGDYFGVRGLVQEKNGLGGYTGALFVAGEVYRPGLGMDALVRLQADGRADTFWSQTLAGCNQGPPYSLTPASDAMAPGIMWVTHCRQWGGREVGGLALLDAAGVPVPGFTALFDREVTYMAQTDAFPDDIWVTGGFTGTTRTAVPYGLARVDAAGTVLGFLGPAGPQPMVGLDGPAFGTTLALDAAGQPTGKVMAYGRFYRLGTVNLPAGLARFNADGTWDPTFNAGRVGIEDLYYGVPRTVVSELGSNGLPTGKLLVASFSSTYNGAPVPAGLYRVDATGVADAAFNPSGVGFDETVYAVVQELDASHNPTGALWVGGRFTTYNGSPCPHGLVRLSADGALDASFNSGGAGFGPWSGGTATVYSMVPSYTAGAPDGSVVVSGQFITYNGTAVSRNAVRVLANGLIDGSFTPPPLNQEAFLYASMVAERDTLNAPTGGLLVAGYFDLPPGSYQPGSVARLRPNGSLDPTFGGAGLWGAARSVALQLDAAGLPTGRVLVAGGFIGAGTQQRMRMALLEADGTLVESFQGQER